MLISNGWSGITKGKLCKGCHEEENDEGLENVTINAVTPLCIKVPFLLPLMCIFFVGFERGNNKYQKA